MNTQLLAGKIEVQGEIAKGQTGTIYYGYDLELRQEMAIKVYHTHINGCLIRGKAFIEKAKPLIRLEHPNLIKVFKVDEQDGTLIVFMEFFDGPSLQHLILSEGPLPVQKMLVLAREIAEVLVHIHFQGIIHGTLHPGHVLVGPQNQIKVMDIGLSWILMDILTNCDAELLRPLPYLLPETAKGELHTLSSDLYCLGLMMYDMLTKGVPYSGLPKTSIMGKLAFDQVDPQFDFPDDVPEAICELIRQMTRNHSSHRIQDATHVLTILNQQLAKFAPETLPPVALADPQPITERQSAKKEAEAPVLAPQEPVSRPSLNQQPIVNRPRHATDYQEIHRANSRKKIWVAMGLTLFLLICGAMGYMYREQLVIPFLSSQDLERPRQPLINKQPPSTVPPMNSFRTPSSEIPVSSMPKTPTPERPRAKTDNTPNNEISKKDMTKLSLPATRESEGSPLDPETTLKLRIPVPPPQEGTRLQTLISNPSSILEPKPTPEQPNTAPSQDHSSIENSSLSKKSVSPPVISPPPTPKSPTNVPEMGQTPFPATPKKPATLSERPTTLPTNRAPTVPDSTFSSSNVESLDNFESQELKDILNSVQIPETVTTLPKDGPSLFVPSPPPPPALPALPPGPPRNHSLIIANSQKTHA